MLWTKLNTHRDQLPEAAGAKTPVRHQSCSTLFEEGGYGAAKCLAAGIVEFLEELCWAFRLTLRASMHEHENRRHPSKLWSRHLQDLSVISQRRTRQIPLHHLRRSSGRVSGGTLSRHSGAKPDAEVNMDQLTPGKPAVPGQTAAGSMLRIRAVMLGDRINPSALEIGTLLASTPVAFRIHAGLVVVFRYGVVVLIGLSPSEETALIETLISRVIGELTSYEEDSAQAQLCNDQSAEVILPGGRICLRSFSDDRLLLIADTLAKSTALERDERRVAAVFDVIEPFARELAERGRTPRGRKGILQLIGNALLVEQRVAGRIAIAEKPDALWEKPELERLYSRLKDEYELKERLEMLERKLSAISGTANALTDIIDTRRSLRLEWVIVVLIVMEVAIGCFQIFTAGR